jgi:predicted nucleotidyltransferase component of viral defense system
LAFLWGTNLRIINNNKRFSEDLDFDNFWLTIEEFDDLSKIIKENLERQGFEVEIKNVYKWAYRCSIKLPKILKSLGWSNLDDEKILIQIDTVSHNFQYKPEQKVLNKFWLVFQINTTPIDIIASQKIYAIFERNRSKWRDFFDLVFLLSKTKPNLDYLKTKMWFNSFEETKTELLKFCEMLDFENLTKDVKPFLIDEDWENSVKFFKEIISESL